ncbi:14669_t:CDS:2, partial [Acaulospora colombiana]
PAGDQDDRSSGGISHHTSDPVRWKGIGVILLSSEQSAYERLRKNELVVFCTLRSLSTTGTLSQLAKRLADHDLKLYSASTIDDSITPLLPPQSSAQSEANSKPLRSQQPESLTPSIAHQFPTELVAEIVDHLGDWELSKAVGLPTSLPCPRAWGRATKLDLAILSCRLKKVQETTGQFYMISAKAAIRFGSVDIIEYLSVHHRATFDRTFGQILPLNASLEGSVPVLNWWKKAMYQPGNNASYDSRAMDAACVGGHVHILQWWVDSQLPLKYTEGALEHASARGHIAVLNWWKQSKLPLKIGRVMELASGAGYVDVLEWWHRSGLDFKYDKMTLYQASCSGRVEVLEWWAQSGLQMMYDTDALVAATKNNKPEALEWWDRSGLPIQYKLCDIEEALEDATIGGGALARAWWERKGVDFRANFTEWTKSRSLH